MKRDFHQLTHKCLAALIITHDEEANICRTLSAIRWIPEVLIIDSGSSDQTLEMIKQFSNTRVIHRKFDTFAQQCNFGLDQLSSDWVLSLDADYVLSTQVSNEISDILSSYIEGTCRFEAYRISFYYCINGKPIRSGLLPPRTCFYKRELAHYLDVGHGHQVNISGRVGRLNNKIFHDDRKSFSRWLSSQKRYQKTEAIMLKNKTSANLPIQDLIRKHTFLAPFSAFFMCLILKGGFLDGREGIIYAFYRLVAESLLYLYMHADTED